MKTRIISLCLVMAMLITMLPKISLPVSAAIPDVWYVFLSTREFFHYILDSDGIDEADFEYAVYDLNADGVTELVLQVTSDAPFFFTFLFALDNGNIILAYEDYGYGSYRYSPKLNMVIGSSETRPDAYWGYSPFYSLSGTWLEYEFAVGQDMGESFYSDDSGNKSISDEERSSYYEDVVWLEFADVTDIPKAEIDADCPYSVEEIEEMVAAYYNKNFTDPTKHGTYVVFGGETWVGNGICQVVVRFQGKTEMDANVFVADVEVDMMTGEMYAWDELIGRLWEKWDADELEPYREILDMYYVSISWNWSNIDGDGWDQVGDPDNVCYLLAKYESHRTQAEVGFALLDINGDGQSELIISIGEWAGDGTILDMYTIMDGQIMHVISAGERDTYNLTEGYKIKEYGSGGWDNGLEALYSLDAFTGKLKVLHAIVHDGGTFTYSTEGFLNPESGSLEGAGYRSISEEDASEILDDFPDNMAIDLIPFADYDFSETDDTVYQELAHAEWIKQHMEYANSAEYDKEIIAGYSEWMMATLRETKNDTTLNSYNARNHLSKILKLDLDFSDAERYELILAELLFGSGSLTLSEREYAEKLKETTSDVVQILYTIVDEADDIDGDVKDGIKDIYTLLQTLEFGTESYGNTFSEFASMVEKNASNVKKGLVEDGLFLVGDILIDDLFEKYDSLEDVLTYASHYMACQNVSEQTVAILEQMLVVCYENYGWAGVDPFIEELGFDTAVINWVDFQTALISVLKAYDTYNKEGTAAAVADYAVEREKEANQKFQTNVIKKVSLFSAEKLLSCVPVIREIIVAKNVTSAAVDISLLLDTIFTNVEDREYAVDMMVKTYCLSILLDHLVRNCASNMKEDDFFSTTVFDESVSIYKKNQLLSSDYMLKYTDLTVADMLEQVKELEIRQRGASFFERKQLQQEIDKLCDRLAWFSRHLKDLEAERAAIEGISCHDPQLEFYSDTNKVIRQFEDSKLYLIACPVDVVIRNETGEQIAYLSGELNQVPLEYRFYFHTIKMNDDSGEHIKVAIVPDGYTVELIGTAEGTMNAFVMDYGAENADVVECYFNIPVEEGTAGYFDTAAEEETSLVMDRESYQDMNSLDNIPGKSGVWNRNGIWIVCGVAAFGIILLIVCRKKKHR